MEPLPQQQATDQLHLFGAETETENFFETKKNDLKGVAKQTKELPINNRVCSNYLKFSRCSPLFRRTVLRSLQN